MSNALYSKQYLIKVDCISCVLKLKHEFTLFKLQVESFVNKICSAAYSRQKEQNMIYSPRCMLFERTSKVFVAETWTSLYSDHFTKHTKTMAKKK